jgi:hypothetical protein
VQQEHATGNEIYQSLSPVMVGTGYVELPSDHAFSAFLAGLTPSRVLRDRERKFTPAERKREAFLRQKAHMEALRRQNGEAA